MGILLNDFIYLNIEETENHIKEEYSKHVACLCIEIPSIRVLRVLRGTLKTISKKSTLSILDAFVLRGLALEYS